MKRKVLMVYPEIPVTFWSLKHSIKLAGYKSLIPPLGLLTVAAMMPDNYEVRLIDMAVTRLKEKDILWADIVFLSGMQIQKESFDEVVRLCNEWGVPVAAGGPYASASCNDIVGVDYFILNEAENILAEFLDDYEKGRARRIYSDDKKPDIQVTPVPRFDLINMADYSSMALQYSRGCPFNCEFCDIIQMFGRVPRTKSPEQFIREMDALYDAGYIGLVFIVDDNFIGNKSKAKALLREIIPWQKERGYPFTLYTEASLDLAQDEELMDLMLEAGLTDLFLGIESPVEETLADIGKRQNIRNSMRDTVRKLQNKGFEVMGGFILGFDTDPDNIFDLQIDFIQQAGIPRAMVGLLSVIPNTALHARLEKEGRILGIPTGDNLALSLNYEPVMPAQKLIEGYRGVIDKIYRPDIYFERCMNFIRELPGEHILWGLRKEHRTPEFYRKAKRNMLKDMKAVVLILGRMLLSPQGPAFIRFMIRAMRYNPGYFVCAMNLAVCGIHFFKMRKDMLKSA